MCILTDRWKARAPTWNYCFLKSWQGSNCKISRNFITAKNSVKVSIKSLNEWIKTSWHHTWKLGKMTYQKVDTNISKISTFPRAIRYGTIYRHRINISICRSITSEEWLSATVWVLHCSLHTGCQCHVAGRREKFKLPYHTCCFGSCFSWHTSNVSRSAENECIEPKQHLER